MSLDPIEFDPADDGAALAADFALGGLDRAERQAAELRLASDPAFRADVEAWQAMLGPLVEAVPPVTAPTDMWRRIEAVIAPPPPVPKPSLWSSVNLWRALAGASTAVAAVAAVLLIGRPGPQPTKLLVATLSSPEGGAMLTATYDAERGAVMLTPAGKAQDDGRTPELWVIEGDNPPRSLGTVEISSPDNHAIPAERLKGLKEGSTLAISLEPAGGSKTGAPTGPIVATGKLTGI